MKMVTSVNTPEKRIIVAFHIGKGGRFHNQGYVTYIGERKFDDLISKNDSNLFEQNRDSNGRFCKPFITDCNGNVIVDQDEYGQEIGRIDFDGDYDTDYCRYVEDCSELELDIIRKSNDYKSNELEEFLKKN